MNAYVFPTLTGVLASVQISLAAMTHDDMVADADRLTGWAFAILVSWFLYKEIRNNQKLFTQEKMDLMDKLDERYKRASEIDNRFADIMSRMDDRFIKASIVEARFKDIEDRVLNLEKNE